MRSPCFALSVLLVVVASCSADSDGRTAGEPAQRVDPEAAGTSASVAAGSPRSEWVVTPTGAGKLRIGMSISEFLPHLAPGADTAAAAHGCAYLPVVDAPDSLGFMVEGGRLVRIDVRGGETPTVEGARIGYTERRIGELYADVRHLPHKYTDGSYLIVIPEAAPDTLHRYVFETDGRHVTTYRAGLFPPVEYVEGCA